MFDFQAMFMLMLFVLTVSFIVWKPRGISETVPTSICAFIVLLVGIVPLSDVKEIFNIVSGASITIISTIVMSIVLESVGFFKWVAHNLVKKSRGSGIILYVYILTLCYLTTLFFNNDGSILITTPIIIRIVTLLRLKPHQQIPYLLSGALIATASSAPIAVSNIANLIALKIVGLDLNSYVAMMFVPSMIGIVAISLLLYLYYRKDIPKKIPSFNLPFGIHSQNNILLEHPLADKGNPLHDIDWSTFRICIIVVVLIRGGFFALTPFGVPLEIIAIVGALLLIYIRWQRQGIGGMDILTKTPWHVLLFAFSMYILVYGLHNVGATTLIVDSLKEYMITNRFNTIMISGVLLTVLSNLFNNLPAVMIGTLSFVEMGLDTHTLQLAYLANIIGSDIGALISPMGTLATLIWMFILRKNKIQISWGQYVKVTILVIPIGLIITLLALYLWTEWLYY
ncbi:MULTISPECIES: arsenic transporter [Metabacillus]|jgi:arsenical pump membrane protein|uniref:Arsenic transporter n=2 Tax=Metabacillus TaxID=2675233 RepID=A0A179T5R3_9BACI|nr:MULTISPECIES: arsenic transporter [Metabacillus]OAS89396.1 arsenic transporter [Metabacillus litoralis]QNF28912.1 arsenic transporter [Metabacillus sp. KUDC1714]